MSNKVKVASVGFFPDEAVLALQALLGYVSEDANELEMAEGLVKRFEEIPGIDLNTHTGRMSYSIAWCPTCKKNVTGKRIRPPIGRCPECKGDDLEDAQEIFVEIDKKERIFLWDLIKKELKGKRTPLLTRKVGRIADAFGKKDEFLILVAPKKDKAEEAKSEETKDAGSPEASGETVAGATAGAEAVPAA